MTNVKTGSLTDESVSFLIDGSYFPCWLDLFSAESKKIQMFVEFTWGSCSCAALLPCPLQQWSHGSTSSCNAGDISAAVLLLSCTRDEPVVWLGLCPKPMLTIKFAQFCALKKNIFLHVYFGSKSQTLLQGLFASRINHNGSGGGTMSLLPILTQ